MLIITTTDKQEQNRLDAIRKYQQAERVARWSIQLRIVKSLEELKTIRGIKKESMTLSVWCRG